MLKELGFEVTQILDGEATEKRLKALPDELKDKLQPNDRLFFYFAGHGVNNSKDYGFLLPIDATSWKDGLSMNNLINTLHESEIKQVFYAADACYSGLVLRSAGVVDAKISGPWKELAQKNRFVTMTAGTDGEQALDGYKGPEDDKPPQGLFTYYLVNGLGGAADSDQDGWINDVELYNYINNNVYKEARRKQHVQTPNYGHTGSGRIFFVNPMSATSE